MADINRFRLAPALALTLAITMIFPAATAASHELSVADRTTLERWALDQGMVMAAIANELLDDGLQAYLATTLRPSLQPLRAMETFGAAYPVTDGWKDPAGARLPRLTA